MPCTPFTLPNGTRAIVCHRTRTPHCACGRPGTLQCDAPSGRKSGTCDRYICAGCAVEVGPDRHLCAAHAAPLMARAQQVIALRQRHNASGQLGEDLKNIVAALALEQPADDEPKQAEMF